MLISEQGDCEKGDCGKGTLTIECCRKWMQGLILREKWKCSRVLCENQENDNRSSRRNIDEVLRGKDLL